MNKTITLIIVIVLIVGAIIFLETKKAYVAGGTSLTPTYLGQYQIAPELSGISGYINTDGKNITLQDLKGKVVIVDFWTYSCINCLRTLPYLNAWYEKYHDKGLEIIGVHTPEFDFEKNYTNVEGSVKKYGVQYPVVLDNDYSTWHAYQNSYWPRKYIVDKDGLIRFDHIGEGGYDETEAQIQELLKEIGVSESGTVNVTDLTPTTGNTPETYLGYGTALPRGEYIGNAGGLKYGDYNYTLASLNLQDDVVYLNGSWKSNDQDIEKTGSDYSSILMKFTAKNANIVIDSQDAQVEVLLDGKPIGKDSAGKDVIIDDAAGISYMNITMPRLYDFYDGTYGTHKIELRTKDPGLKANAFTFG